MAYWTSEQHEAINARDCNLLVAAAAGSGKTSVLVARIIRLVLQDRIDIDRMLIVTFTQAAAGEMREKINNAIFRELGKGKENIHLRRQLYLLNRSSISTIHAFCSSVVRQHFHLLNVDPHFKIADSTESELIKMEALEELLDGEYEKGEDYFLNLLDYFSGNTDDKMLESLILRLYSFIQSHPQPLEWLKEKTDSLLQCENDWKDNPWACELCRQISIELHAAKDILNYALGLSNKIGGPRGYIEAIENDLKWASLMLKATEQGLPALYSCLQQFSFARLGRVARDTDETLKIQVKNLRDESKKIINTIRNLLARNPLEYLNDLKEIYPVMKSLGKLIGDFTKLYQEKKREKGLADFNDLEHLALQALSNETVAQEYRDYYDYIFVDEYQDSNLVQETILNYIKKEDNLFMVGDVKQSIYRFRLADPTLFLEKQNSFPRDEGSVNRKIDLNKNFRSHPEILNAVNYVFRHLMTEELGEIDYDEESFLYPGLITEQEMACVEINAPPQAKRDINESSRVELYLLENNPDLLLPMGEVNTEGQNEMNEAESNLLERIIEMDNTEMEALLIAQKIHRLVGEDIYDAKKQCKRKIEYRDIVILLRATRNSAGIFTERLNAEGIPVYADASSGYFDTLELNLFLNLLRLIDNKRQDIALLSVMRSPIGGFDIDDFIKIRTYLPLCREGGVLSFYEATEMYIEENDDDLRDRLVLFIKRLREWDFESRIMDLEEFIGKLMMDTGFYHYIGALPGGEQRQANLRILLHRAKEFKKSSFKGLFNFINYIEKVKSSGSDMGNACVIGENDNVVRLMSIHKSKGLEFPVVIVGGLGKNFNIRDSSESVLLHRQLGIGPRYVNTRLRTYYDTIARLAIRNKIKMENMAEEMRILYVACTRPQEKLVLVGTTRRLESAWPKWRKPINPYNQSKAKNYLDWLIPIILRHKEEGRYLREIAGGDWENAMLCEDTSKWGISLVNPQHLTAEETKKEEARNEWAKLLEEGGCPSTSVDKNEIISRLNWKYPYREAERIPAKLSVSQISKIKRGGLGVGGSDTFLIRIPAFSEGEVIDQGQQYSPIEKGSAVHLLMQNIDYRQVSHKDNIKKQLAQMVDREIFTPEQSAAIDLNDIWQFFQTQLGQRVIKAKRLFREAPFILLIPAGEIFPGTNSPEKLLVQGIIDLYFYEGEDIVLLDYKSDRVLHKNEEEAIAPYKTQANLYRRALEEITGKRVKETYLYFFDLNRAIMV